MVTARVLLLVSVSLSLVASIAGQCCDVDVTAFSMTVTQFDTAAATPFDFSITIRNTDASNVIDPATTGVNYNMEIKFTEYDLRSIGSASDTLPAGADPANDALSTLSPTGVNTVSLNPSGTVTMAGSTELILDAADCAKANYVCAHVYSSAPDSQYNDSVDYNDWRCVAITRNCEVDINMTSFSPSPPDLAYGVDTTQNIDFIITNTGTTTGEDIAAVTAGNANFAIVWQLAKADGSVVGTPFPITFTPSDLRQALTNSGTLTLSGSVTYGLPTDATCTDVAQVCAVLSVGSGASFQEPDPDVESNVHCEAVTRAAPDCQPVITNLDATVSVPENTTDNSTLFTPVIEGPATFTITTMTPTVPGLQMLDPNTGVLSLVGSEFDYETQTNYTVVIEATSASGTTTSGTLTISITDVNEPPVVSPNDTVTIPEDFTGVIPGFTLSKDDPDVLDRQGIVYSIQSYLEGPAPSGPFTIDPDTGVITVGTSPVALDYETSPNYWVLEIIGVDVGAPSTPSQMTGTVTLTVLLANVDDEPPSCPGLPSSVDIYENETAAAVFATITCTDDGPNPIALTMGVSPLTDKFTLDGNELKYGDNPGFNFEETNTYDIHVFVTDGTTDWRVITVTVNILDVVELPYFTNLPANVSFSENFHYGMEVFYIEYNSTSNAPAVNLTLVDAFPYSGLDKFRFYEPSGLVHTRWMPDLNYEVDKWYNLTFELCAVEGCVRQNLTVFIEDENEYPVCDPDNFTLVVSENQGINTGVGLQLSSGVGNKYVQDVDVLDTASYSILDSTYSSYIKIYGDDIQLKEGFDFDGHKPPHKFTVSVAATDQPPNVNQSGLTCYHTLTVYVTNSDDRRPTFADSPPADYVLDIPEDTPAGSAIATITVTDMDLGTFGVQDIKVDPSDATALKYFTMGPITRDGFTYTAELQVAGALDVETDSNIVFKLIASDTFHNTEQSVTVRVQNVNDHRPIFNPTFYNYEVSSTAYTGKLIPYGLTQAVSATDGDIIYQNVNYFIVHTSAEFELNALSGSLTAKAPPYPEYREYVLYLVATDNDHEPKTSLVARARVDTYKNEDVLTNWTFNCAASTFSTEASRAKFLDNMATICSPCLPRIHEMYSSGSQTLFVLYFLTDSTTEAVGNIGVTKTYIPASEIMSLYTTDQVQTPTSAVTSNAALSSCPVTKITYFLIPTNDFNWILDTIEGNLFLGFLMSVIWTIIMTSAICLARYFTKDRGFMIKRLDTPSKEARKPKPREPTPPTPVKELKQDDGDLYVMDFRYADRAHVQTAEESKVKAGL